MNKWLVLCCAAIVGLVSADISRGSDKVKVFLLAGQSNMVGYGRSELGLGDVPGAIGSLRYQVNNDPANFGHLVDEFGNWIVRDDVWVWSRQSEYIYQPPGDADKYKTGNLTVGFGDTRPATVSKIGPEFGFGTVVGDFVDDQVVLIKAAWGGAALASEFRSPSAVAKRGGTVGEWYNLMTGVFQTALIDVAAQFPGKQLELTGFGWHQGWSDRDVTTFANEYEDNLADFIVDVRTALGAPNLPFVIAETGMGGPTESDPDALTVMAAQAAMADPLLHPEFAGNVAFVDTQAYWRDVGVSPRNVIFHWNENGETYYLIGDAMGRAMVELIPEPTAAMLLISTALLVIRRRHP